MLAEAARLHAVPPPPAAGPARATPAGDLPGETLSTPSTPATPVEWPEAAPTEAGWAGGELRVLDCLGRAWHLWQRHLLLITGASALAWGIQTLPQLLPQVFGCLGLLASLAVSGAVYGGLSVLILGLIRGNRRGRAICLRVLTVGSRRVCWCLWSRASWRRSGWRCAFCRGCS
ncbi:MAG: hypothetical protein M5U12_10760 [Verrucomicrobia bacterium]|nr:hypothetical protein [Verrucomicrobiota bacterium]